MLFYKHKQPVVRAVFAAFVFAWAIAFSSSNASAQQSVSGPLKWHGWWELGGTFGSDDSNRGEVVLFTPFGQTATSLFFADIRGKLFERDNQEGNFALGHREMFSSGWNLGIWGGVDVRRTDADNTFWQASVGVEALSERWDVRVNGYVPLSEPKGSPGAARVFLSGGNIFMTGGEEVPLGGIDGEIGFRLFGGRGGSHNDGLSRLRRHELRVYGGGFWFDDDDALEKVAGPKARIEFRIEDVIAPLPGSRLTFEGEVSHDGVRDSKWEIGARLRIPFGGPRAVHASAYAPLSAQERRMTEGLERDTDIVTGASNEENVISTETTQLITSATQVTPGTNADTAASAAGAGGMLIINGAINQDGSIINMATGQIVAGGGTTIPVRGANSGTAANFVAPGAAGTLGGGLFTGGDSIRTASNALVAGLNFIPNVVANTAHVVIDNDNNVTVRDTVHSVSTSTVGIRVTSSRLVRLHDITATRFSGVGGGLSVGGANSTVTVDNFVFDGGGGGPTGFSIIPTGVSTVTLTNVSATGAPTGNGLTINSQPGSTINLTVGGSTFSGNNNGVLFGLAAGTINLGGSGNTINTNTTNCLVLAGPTINGAIGAAPGNCPP